MPEAYLALQRGAQLDRLFELLRIPSVSALPEHAQDVRRAARWLQSFMAEIGLEHVAVQETGGHPAVYADHLHAPGRPTLLVYGHYDVQPPDPLEAWQSPPFAPTLRDGLIYARGATDDKGQLLMHLFVLQGLLAAGDLPLNVRLLIEGEEEIGSPHLGPFVHSHRDLLRADCAVISDSPMLRAGVPAICVGLRGLAALELSLRTAAADLHSGNFGGAVPNAAHVLAELVASLHDGDGRVAVPGFYEGVRELADEERRELAALGFADEEFLRQAGTFGLYGEAGRTTLERLWTRPTLEVNGLWSGFSGEGRKTIVPALAQAKLTCRLVPDQDPAQVLRAVQDHLATLCPPFAHLEIEGAGGAPAFLAPAAHPARRAAEDALRAAFGKQPDIIRMGGSIPIVTTFAAELAVPTLLLGFGLPDENLHAPNEHFSLENFAKGMVALWRFYAIVGEKE